MEILSIRNPNYRYSKARPRHLQAGSPQLAVGSPDSRLPTPDSREFWKRQLPVWAVAILIAALTIFPMYGQLQQSGGGGSNASVGSTGATAPSSATLAGGAYKTTPATLTDGQMGAAMLDSTGHVIVVGQGTAGAAAGGVVSVQGVASGTALPISGTITAVTAITNALPAGTNLIGYTRPGNACSTTNYESGMAMLPATATSLTATATCVSYILINNTDSVAHPITITDQSTACNSGVCSALSTFSLPAYSQLMLPMYGVKFTGGIKWNTDAANKVVGDIIGNQ